jgi:hypothetical protein
VTLGTANGLSLSTQQLSLQLASGSQNGALSSTDWTTFNSKENAITAGTTAQYFRGDKTFQTLNTSVVPENTNLYYTEARVSANTDVAANTAARHNAVTLGTANGLSLSTQQLSLGLASAGVTGALSGTDWSTFNSKQQALNGTGFVKISGTTISYDNSTYYLASNPSAFIALTALSGTAPIQYNNTTGAISITQASGSTNGFLSSTDWTAFNSKQQALNGTGFVKISGTTISYDNSTYLTGNQTITLSGDATGSGATAITVVLANSGVTAGTYNDSATQVRPFTVDAKGRITSIGTAVTITPDWANISGQRTLTRDDAGLQGNAGARSGFFETVSPVNYYSGANSWQHLIESRHTNDSNNYAMQIAGSFFDQEFYVRKTNNSATTAWSRVWHSGNITPVTGTGTTNYLPKFTGTSTIGNSLLSDNGTNIGLGIANPTAGRLQINVSDTTTAAHFQVIDGTTTLANSFVTNFRNANDGNSRYSLSSWQAQNAVGNDQIGFIGVQSITGGSNYTPNIVFGQKTGASTYATRMTLDASGNLGLGVTPSAWNLYKAIQVQNASISNYDNSDNSIVGSNVFYGGSPNDFRYISTGTSTVYRLNNSVHSWFIAPLGTAGDAISFTQAMTLGSNSGLSIGTPSAAPAQGLLVQGEATFSSNIIFANNNTGINYGSSRFLLYNGTNTYIGDIDGLSATASTILRTNGVDRLTILATGAATFSSSVTASNGAFGAVGGFIVNFSANAASRSWRLINDINSFGDFQIQQSTTQTGSTYANVLAFTSTGAATFSSDVTIGASSQLYLTSGDLRYNSNAGFGIVSQNGTRLVSIQNGAFGVTGAATFSGDIGWGGITPTGNAGISSTLESVQGAQIAARQSVPQLYISSNVSGTPFAPTRKVEGYAVQLSLDALGGTISLNRAVSSSAGSAITWLNNLGFDNTGAATFSSSVTANTGVTINRASLTASNPLTWTTSGTLDWFFGSSPLGNSTSDLSLYSYGTNSVVFHVAKSTGAATFSSSVTASRYTSIGSSSYTNDFVNTNIGTVGQTVGIRFGYDGSTYNKGAVYFISKSAAGVGDLIFALNNSENSANVSTSDERMRITSGGNVLIGTTSDNGSRLRVNGSVSLPHTTKSANYTLTDSDYTVGFDCASNRTATLPDATTCAGRVYVIYQYNTATGGSTYVTLDGNGSQTIDGVTTYSLQYQEDFSSVMIQSTGSNWVVISDKLYPSPV